MSENNFYDIRFDDRYTIVPNEPDDTIKIESGTNVWFDLNDTTNTIKVNAGNGLSSIVVNGTELTAGVLTLMAGDDIVLIPDQQEGTITIQADRGYIFDTFNVLDQNVTPPIDTDISPSNNSDTLVLKAGDNIRLVPDANTHTVEINSVAGETVNAYSKVVADSTELPAVLKEDTITFIPGENVSFDVDPSTNTITVNATGGSGDQVPSYGVVRVGQTPLAADEAGDVIYLNAGDNVDLAADRSTNTVTISSTAPGFGEIVVGTKHLLPDQSGGALTLKSGSNMKLEADSNTDTIRFIAEEIFSQILLYDELDQYPEAAIYAANYPSFGIVRGKGIDISFDENRISFSVDAFKEVNVDGQTLSSEDNSTLNLVSGDGIDMEVNNGQIEMSTGAFDTIIIKDWTGKTIDVIYPTNAANTFKLCSPDNSIDIHAGLSGTPNENTIYLSATGGGGGGGGGEGGIGYISFGDGYAVTPDDYGSVYFNNTGNLYLGSDNDNPNQLYIHSPSLEAGDGITITDVPGEQWYPDAKTISARVGTGFKIENGMIVPNIPMLRQLLGIDPMPPEPLEGTAYAVFDSSGGSLRFFRAPEGSYYDGQVNGSKTYYTGVEGANFRANRHIGHEELAWVSFDEPIRPISMANWFYGCHDLTSIENMENLDTSYVTNMDSAFYGCNALTALDLSGWDTTRVTNMSSMFAGCSGLTQLDLGGWVTSNVEKMSGMFNGCSGLTKDTLNMSGWDVSSVTNMYQMFKDCRSLTSFDLSVWDVSNVNNTSYMFENCTGLASLNLSNWNVSSVTQTTAMLKDCSSLTSLDIGNWDVSNAENMSFMFENCTGLTSLNIGGWDVSSVTNMSRMFNGCTNLTSLLIGDWDVSSVTDMQSTFSDSGVATLPIGGWDVSNVTNMYNMFSNCTGLTSLNLSGWDVSNNTVTGYMFENCTGLTSLNLSGWDVSSVTNMSRMFNGCTNLTSLNISGWNPSVVENTSWMFRNCRSLTTPLNLNNWNTSSVTDMSAMFVNCSSLTSLLVNSWDTSSVTDMSRMFSGCSSLTSLRLDNWNTLNVTTMAYMFCDCIHLENLHMESALFITQNVESFIEMFNNCLALSTTLVIKTTTDTARFDNMFDNAASVIPAEGTRPYISLMYSNPCTSAIIDNLINTAKSVNPDSNIVNVGEYIYTNLGG